MYLSLKYEELSKFIKERYSKDIEFQYVDDCTVKVILRVKVLITVPISVNLVIKEVNADKIVLRCDGKGLDLIIKGLFSFLDGKLDQRGCPITCNDNQELVIHYSSIDKIAQTLKYLTLQNISFDTVGILVTAALR